MGTHLVSLALTEMQVRTTVRNYYKPRMARLWTSTLLLGKRNGTVTIETVWQFFLVRLGFELRASHLQSRSSTTCVAHLFHSAHFALAGWCGHWNHTGQGPNIARTFFKVREDMAVGQMTAPRIMGCIFWGHEDQSWVCLQGKVANGLENGRGARHYFWETLGWKCKERIWLEREEREWKRL
jgi:hypothetical protein